MTEYLLQAFIYLCAAVVMVPLANRMGLGSVLGYLIAGVLIGPVAGLVGNETTTIQHFAEFGVVMMLFLVGLELEPKALWAMRHRLLGLGGLQVGLTIAIVSGIALAFGLTWSVALAVGLIFSLSSTAIVLQTFKEKGLSKTEGGKTAFSVLLFQDIAVIPMLALIPLLALPELKAAAEQMVTLADQHEQLSLVAHLPGWLAALVVIATIVGVVVAGHYLSRPIFRYVADSGLREVFTAAALMLVIGIAALMSLVGLSPALGTFMAGVVLANSEFRHELESDIEPFKGLLLGLFFITVGAGIDFQILASNLLLVLGLTLGLMLVKALVLLGLSFVFGVHSSNRWLFTLSLAQAGEFGFVLLSYSAAQHVLPHDLVQLLAMVVALSMFLTPVLFIGFERIIQPRYANQKQSRQSDRIDAQGPVIIAGIGRFGQVVNRLLIANDITTVVLDYKASQVDLMRGINIKSFYGDASRPDLLEAAGIEQASLLVIAIDDRARATELVKFAKQRCPNLQVLARAYDRGHHFQLRHAGADFIVSETYHSALEMGRESLSRLGVHPFLAEQMKQTFVETEQKFDPELYLSWRDVGEKRSFGSHYQGEVIRLQSLLIDVMKTDRIDSHARSDRGWTPPPKGYTEDFK